AVWAHPPVVEGMAETLVGPREAPQDFGFTDLTAADARLVGHDEAAIEGRTHPREGRRHVRREHGVAVSVDDRAVIPSTRERATPIEKERGRRGHERTLARTARASPERRCDFTQTTRRPRYTSRHANPTETTRGGSGRRARHRDADRAPGISGARGDASASLRAAAHRAGARGDRRRARRRGVRSPRDVCATVADPP